MTASLMFGILSLNLLVTKVPYIDKGPDYLGLSASNHSTGVFNAVVIV